MRYINLIGEMAKKNISIEDVSKLLDLHRNTISNKINGNGVFSINDAIKIREQFFPEQDVEYLFKKQ